MGDQFWHPQGVQVKAPNYRFSFPPLQWTGECSREEDAKKEDPKKDEQTEEPKIVPKKEEPAHQPAHQAEASKCELNPRMFLVGSCRFVSGYMVLSCGPCRFVSGFLSCHAVRVSCVSAFAAFASCSRPAGQGPKLPPKLAPKLPGLRRDDSSQGAGWGTTRAPFRCPGKTAPKLPKTDGLLLQS